MVVLVHQTFILVFPFFEGVQAKGTSPHPAMSLVTQCGVHGGWELLQNEPHATETSQDDNTVIFVGEPIAI